MKSHICILFMIALIASCERNTDKTEFDFTGLTSRGDWSISIIDSTSSSGHIKLKNEKWMMHFLHWWPLDESRKNISVKYARKLLNNLWGMQFTETGNYGETIVNGHKAYYVEGKLEEFVLTRFIVWNCPGSNRQFLSDCNINLALDTEKEYLDMQTGTITNSIKCHNSESSEEIADMFKTVDYGDQHISFTIPESWYSDFFIIDADSDNDGPGYYKNGITENRGVIWNLCTESEKEINLLWNKRNKRKPASLLENHFSDTVYEQKDTLCFRYYYINCNITKRKLFSDNILNTTGEYRLVNTIRGSQPFDTSRYIFSAYSWLENGKEYCLIGSMVAHDNIWGVPVDLEPGNRIFEKFLNNELRTLVSEQK